MNGIDSKVIYVLANIYMYIQWPIIKKKKEREKKISRLACTMHKKNNKH